MQSKSKNNTGWERLDLDRRYGKIGIPAVAAAVRYQSDPKKPADAPALAQGDAETEDVAA